MAKPFGVLVCVYRVRPVLEDLFLLLKSHIWHGPECVTEQGALHKVAVCESQAVLHARAYHTIFARACKAVYLC
jgi:hypothetical protein